VKLYYWRGKRPNFGDELAPLLLESFGVPCERVKAAEAAVVVVGSIAEHLPAGYTGAVLGIGKAHEETRLDLRRARVFALRGPLTLRRSMALGSVVLGDPGLLAERLLDQPVPVVYDVGFVPHYADRGAWFQTPPGDGLLIDVTGPPLRVLRAIAECGRIVTSSLHGLVVADALGRPRKWELYDRVQGAGFKFADYSAALGEDLRPGVWRTARTSAVRAAQADLSEAFQQFAAEG